jgi:hypothetical protein
MTLSEILKDSNYTLTQFNLPEQDKLEKRIKTRKDNKKLQVTQHFNTGNHKELNK